MIWSWIQLIVEKEKRKGKKADQYEQDRGSSRNGVRLARRGESLLKTLVYNSAIRDQYLSRLADPSSSPTFHPPFFSPKREFSLIPPILPNYCRSYAQFRRNNALLPSSFFEIDTKGVKLGRKWKATCKEFQRSPESRKYFQSSSNRLISSLSIRWSIIFIQRVVLFASNSFELKI